MLKNSFQNKFLEAGCDEAGRGPLAGPVVGAAVILPKNFSHPILNDSKQLTEKERNELRIIIEKEAISWGVGIVSPKKIDEINILNASYLAIHRAIQQMKIEPEFIHMDGNRFKTYNGLTFETTVKGDAKFLNIAAASILAKTYRDEIMKQYHEEFPMYGWKSNKGYPTKQHRRAIFDFGACKYHRKSFQLLPYKQEKLFT